MPTREVRAREGKGRKCDRDRRKRPAEFLRPRPSPRRALTAGLGLKRDALACAPGRPIQGYSRGARGSGWRFDCSGMSRVSPLKQRLA